VKTKPRENCYQGYLAKWSVYELLEKCDADLAEKCRQAGCLKCGGRLDRSDYRRKPRGGPEEGKKVETWRDSFCCDVEGCRKRHTPPSVRFLGRKVYWGVVVVLLAAMLPVANAVATTGTADMIARFFLDNVTRGNAVIGLVALMVVTMFLSDLVNNAATAAVMCPIAISTAAQLGVNADAFLMAIAVGASCAFLTPIGHQNNTLILGPGGFRFGDYWRLGLLLEVIVVLVSIPVILWVWPL